MTTNNWHPLRTKSIRSSQTAIGWLHARLMRFAIRPADEIIGEEDLPISNAGTSSLATDGLTFISISFCDRTMTKLSMTTIGRACRSSFPDDMSSTRSGPVASMSQHSAFPAISSSACQAPRTVSKSHKTIAPNAGRSFSSVRASANGGFIAQMDGSGGKNSQNKKRMENPHLPHARTPPQGCVAKAPAPRRALAPAAAKGRGGCHLQEENPAGGSKSFRL